MQKKSDSGLGNYLDTIFGLTLEDEIDGSHVCVVRKMKTGKWKLFRCTNMDQIQELVDREKDDLYLSLSLVKDSAEKRGTESEVTSIFGFGVDLDVKEPTDKCTNPFRSREEIWTFIQELKNNPFFCPTMITSSGGGFHLYYLFDEPERITNEEERAYLKTMVASLVVYIGNLAGKTLDHTKDLVRVWRIPGTMNTKQREPSMVELIDHTGVPFGSAGIGMLVNADPQAFTIVTGEEEKLPPGDKGRAFSIRPDLIAPIHPDILSRLIDDALFSGQWHGFKPTASGEMGDSELDYSILSQCLHMGVGWQAGVNAASRSRLSRDVMGIKKVEREDYWGRAIMKMGIPDFPNDPVQMYPTPLADENPNGFVIPLDVKPSSSIEDVLATVNRILSTEFSKIVIEDSGADVSNYGVIAYTDKEGFQGVHLGTRFQLLSTKQWKKMQKIVGDVGITVPQSGLRQLVDNIFLYGTAMVDESERKERAILETIGGYLLESAVAIGEDTDWMEIAGLVKQGEPFVKDGELFFFRTGMKNLLEEKGLWPVSSEHWRAVDGYLKTSKSQVPLILDVASGGTRRTYRSGYKTTVRNVESAIGDTDGTQRSEASDTTAQGLHPSVS